MRSFSHLSVLPINIQFPVTHVLLFGRWPVHSSFPFTGMPSLSVETIPFGFSFCLLWRRASIFRLNLDCITMKYWLSAHDYVTCLLWASGWWPPATSLLVLPKALLLVLPVTPLPFCPSFLSASTLLCCLFSAWPSFFPPLPVPFSFFIIYLILKWCFQYPMLPSLSLAYISE